MKKPDDQFPGILHAFYLEGASDDIYLAEILWDISDAMGFDRQKIASNQTKELWEAVERFMPLMLSQFWAVDLSVENKKLFATPWPNQTPEAVLARIKEKWIAYNGKEPDVWYLVWFRRKDKVIKTQ
ncbi:MAG: hypothetical protein JO126_04515 [Alphaproteobacteria bacterium]|nr:hypothetical protein [Alphaproteobacteria bacterium]MBV8548700.1 hypothetical protein [Alphaproteobacteria bacterium]